MPNIVGNSWITVLTVLSALSALIVAIVVPTALYRLSKKKKKLTCIVFPSLSLVDIRTEVKDKIKIYYDEKLVENLSMTKVKIRNNGNLSIRREDIIKPLEFEFAENLNVIDFSLIDTEPEGITAKLESNRENNLVRCVFDLLNAGDELTLQFVFLGESKELPNVTARIEGVKQIDVEPISGSEEEIERIKKDWKRIVYLGLAMFVLGVIPSIFWDLFWEFGAFFAGGGIVLIILGILSKISIRKHPILLKFFVSGFKK